LCAAGLTAGEPDYDAVASWLCYNFVCTGGSLVREYRRVAAGTVARFDPAGRAGGATTYAAVRFGRDPVPPPALADALVERVRAAFDRLVAGEPELSVPLSGGFDSRLVAALAAEPGRPPARLTVVGTRPAEVAVARRVAAAVGLPLGVIPVDRQVVDLFDDPLYVLPEGLPVPRNLTAAVARRRPGVAVASGFMGDVLMRAPINAAVRDFLALDDRGLGDADLADAADRRYRVWTNRLHLLRGPVAARAVERARAAMADAVRRGRPTGRPLAWTNLALRHGVYFAAVFQGHLAVADALLPFATWALADYHARHGGSFAGGEYPTLFRRHFPRLAGVPHEAELPPPPPARPRAAAASRHLRRWSAALLRGLPDVLAGASAVDPRKLLRRLPGGLLLDPSHPDELGYLHRVRAMETAARRANVRIDWSRL
ncbi:MAG TPA: asparagine synthase-related protein, partial [Humisphaera sp.]